MGNPNGRGLAFHEGERQGAIQVQMQGGCQARARDIEPQVGAAGVGRRGQELVNQEAPAAADGTVCTRQLRREAEEQRRRGCAGRVVRSARGVDAEHGDVHVAARIAPGEDTGVAFAGDADVDQGAVGGVGEGQLVDLGEIDDIGQARRGQAGRLVAGDAHRPKDGGPVAAEVRSCWRGVKLSTNGVWKAPRSGVGPREMPRWSVAGARETLALPMAGLPVFENVRLKLPD